MYRLVPLLLVLGVAGCGRDPLTCADLERDVDGGTLTCNPQSPPTYDNAYRDTFSRSCAKAGCHKGATARGGLDLEDKDAGYNLLLDEAQGRVVPGDPECSEVVERIFTTDSDWHMPPGKNLSDAEKCTIVQWIDLGALR